MLSVFYTLSLPFLPHSILWLLRSHLFDVVPILSSRPFFSGLTFYYIHTRYLISGKGNEAPEILNELTVRRRSEGSQRHVCVVVTHRCSCQGVSTNTQRLNPWKVQLQKSGTYCISNSVQWLVFCFFFISKLSEIKHNPLQLLLIDCPE